jgi:CubicO group peptidase (beta-lactamase class C family)
MLTYHTGQGAPTPPRTPVNAALSLVLELQSKKKWVYGAYLLVGLAEGANTRGITSITSTHQTGHIPPQQMKRAYTSRLTPILLSLLVFSLPVVECTTTVASLTQSLQKIVDDNAVRNNISYSFAVVSDQFTVTVASGVDDHNTGRRVTTESLYPAGSVTKPYTAVAAMRLHDKGVLDLEEPVYTILDPWLKSQSIPSLLTLWNNDPTILNVTSRHLLGMQVCKYGRVALLS